MAKCPICGNEDVALTVDIPIEGLRCYKCYRCGETFDMLRDVYNISRFEDELINAETLVSLGDTEGTLTAGNFGISDQEFSDKDVPTTYSNKWEEFGREFLKGCSCTMIPPREPEDCEECLAAYLKAIKMLL